MDTLFTEFTELAKFTKSLIYVFWPLAVYILVGIDTGTWVFWPLAVYILVEIPITY